VSILEGAIFDYGFELKDKHNISLFGKSIEMKITLDGVQRRGRHNRRTRTGVLES